MILAVWKLPCAVTLLIPGVPRLKEWAYAGAFFNYSGAAASHRFVGDGPTLWIAPAVFAVMTLASGALRPSHRRLSPPSRGVNVSAGAWLLPAAVVVVMLIVALLTLPQGPAPL